MNIHNVCMHMCIYTNLYVYVYTILSVQTLSAWFKCGFTHSSPVFVEDEGACIYMYIYMYACMYVCMHVRMFVCTYACMHVCMFVCVCVCVCIYVCLLFSNPSLRDLTPMIREHNIDTPCREHRERESAYIITYLG